VNQDEAIGRNKDESAGRPLVRRCDGFLFPQLGQLGAGAALDEQRNKIPYRTLVESRVRALDGSRDLIRREMRIPAGQSALDFGNQQLLADLGHIRQLCGFQGQPSTGSSPFGAICTPTRRTLGIGERIR
jgi:hypothetical protein